MIVQEGDEVRQMVRKLGSKELKPQRKTWLVLEVKGQRAKCKLIQHGRPFGIPCWLLTTDLVHVDPAP